MIPKDVFLYVCVQDLQPGILVQQHYDGTTFFHRAWSEYKVGFGDVTGNYWIGNDRLHELTKYGQSKMRFDLKAKANNQWYWAEYSTFKVDSESNQYSLHVGGYNGTAGDGLSHANGMKFSTVDRDNDVAFGGHCTVSNGRGGGFWYNNCKEVITVSAGIIYRPVAHRPGTVANYSSVE